MQTSKRDEAVDAISSPSNPAHWYAYASSAFLISLSLPLLLFPRLLLLLSTPRGAVGQPTNSSTDQNAISAIGPELTPLERYGSHTNAISMLAMSALILVLSGAIPVTTAPMPDTSSAGKSPFRIPTVVVTAVYFAANAFTAWSAAGVSQSKGKTIDPAELGIGTFGKVVGLAHAAFAFWGLGVWMFGNDLTRNRKKAGDQSAKDKSVSGFPFKNQYATEEKRKKST
ncbi:hypothetical protein PHBOTO_005149 [Pseudozyma hubeiensis]|nr:hypothetical protein PHBOTO_005149 [Pseudozyma hubeiensis]